MTPYQRTLLRKYLLDNCEDVQTEWEIDVYRSKGRWFLETDDQEAINMFFSNGHILVYKSSYVETLEELLVELIQKSK